MQLLTSMTTMMDTLLEITRYTVCLRMCMVVVGQVHIVQETLNLIIKDHGASMSKTMMSINGIMTIMDLEAMA